ncbi:MAG: SLBB domain-containing protein [Bdellovibrionales bacterium]|nr:SLBB domain-containing protein [Bdellovibrionales bacterium]
MIKRIIKIILCFQFLFVQQIFAQSNTLSRYSLMDEAFRTRLSEYFYNQNNVDILVPVRLMGNIAKPGLYHVPANTSMLTLLTISGGPIKNADIENIKVSTYTGQHNQVSMKQLIQSEAQYMVKKGDVIYIPEKDVTFDQNTVNAFTVISGIISVLLTGFLVAEQIKND